MRLRKEAKVLRKRFIVFLALSLLVHLFFLFGTPNFIFNPQSATKEKEPLMVELDPSVLKDLENKKSQQIVNTEKTDNANTPKDAKYLGEHNQEVEKQTKARTVDTFRQGGGLGVGQRPSIALKSLAPQPNFDAKPTPKEETGDTAEKIKQRKLAQAAAPQGGGGGPNAANNDLLKDVQDGDKTLLSTKEFVYFGYYNRIRQKLETAWNNRLRNVFQDSGWVGGHGIASNQSYYTRVVVELDRHGRITAVQMLEASGAKDLDRAAVEAFNQAGPFPDPPSGLVEKDGKIRVPWGFNVST